MCTLDANGLQAHEKCSDQMANITEHNNQSPDGLCQRPVRSAPVFAQRNFQVAFAIKCKYLQLAGQYRQER